MIRELSNYNDHTGDMKPAYHGDPVRCYAYLAPLDKFGIRANTVAAYCDINRKVCLNKQRTVTTAAESVNIWTLQLSGWSYCFILRRF
jgi:hypothetical protein